MKALVVLIAATTLLAGCVVAPYPGGYGYGWHGGYYHHGYYGRGW